MKYISTRGQIKARTFVQAVIEGLSRDGGLLIPAEIPDFSNRLARLQDLSYTELALEIFKPFIGDELPTETTKRLVENSYSTFKTPEITPTTFTDSIAILELFHGPTLAFKDIALQFLGNLFEEILKTEKISLNILGATSGDTGSAAIHGVRGKAGITIFMLHPKGKISPIQEKQMTTVLDDNVVNIAIEGTFDDAQRIVKDIFTDLEFKDQYHLGAVNSINWARVMAQIVYYFFAAFRFQEKYPDQPVVFSVPTGNFGDIYAGYLAKKMGLPIEKLILATNENDILFRVINSGIYKIGNVTETYSPSMDIQVSSNFERFLFDILGQNGSLILEKMNSLTQTSEFQLSKEEVLKIQEELLAIRIDNNQTLETIKKYYDLGIVMDPHTAVGVAAAEQSDYRHVICLSTAHPAKFSDAVIKATGKEAKQPASLVGILEKESRCLTCHQEKNAVKKIITEKLTLEK